MPRLVRPGGVVFTTTPFSWLSEFTPREHWMGGPDGGDSQAEMAAAMADRGFEVEKNYPIPLVIREHARKYQYIVADATLWRRK